MAQRFSLLMRRLFGEGSLLAGFSPNFESARAVSPKEGALFFRDLAASLSLFLTLLIGCLEVLLFVFMSKAGLTQETREILSLTMTMLPGVFFICLYALFSALLQSERQYFVSAASPLMYNVMFLVAIFWVKDWVSQAAMEGLAVAVVVAFLCQWLMVVPGVIKLIKPHLSWKEWLQPKLFSPQFIQMVKGIIYTVIGVGAVQINTAIDTLFAHSASLSGPAYLNYAIRLYHLPLSLFGIALASALLPPLSRAIQGGQVADYLKLIHFALSRSFSLIFPCSVAVLVLGAPAVNLIYGHGLFDFQATVQTTICLWAYGVGLMPAVLVLLLSPAFYAQKDFLTPLKASLVSVGLSILLNTILVFFLELGSFSIALATSVAAFVNYRLLSHKLKRVVGPIFDQESRRSCVKVVICSCLAGISTLLAGYYVVNDPTLRMFLNSGNIQFARELLSQLVQFLSLSAIFGLFLFLFAWLFKAEGILSFVRRKSLAN
jgi:putative peptidoglycan lipid II flippase